ncbi:NUDIX domain-containing protein [Weissella viridescens]|uniref:NUDIX domain-containing protein n=1 Tax=Weissella viridescens TaxID=1629 RepID=A0A3P2RFN0_WEIVI|nr:NUDIX hydrolase [Weissella viridescens]RRG17630.1 NUDIX domain-containing protein [Weissella viridescens]
MVQSKVHQSFGVYGLIVQGEQLAVVKKTDGPYKNRFDLPGGQLEPGEILENALNREIEEETGLLVKVSQQLGTTSFHYPWHYLDFVENQHIAVFYHVLQYTGQIQAQVPDFIGQDVTGALFVNLRDISASNASPLVLKAKQYLTTGHFDVTATQLNHWQVLD